MQRYYGIDTTDLWRGTLSLRRLRVLLDGLPPDCLTAYAIAGQDLTAGLAGWRLNDLLLGRLVDEVAIHRWQWESAHRDPKKSGRHRPAPDSVLPDVHDAVPTRDAPARPKVIPLVSPHALGGFVNNLDDEEV